MWIKILASYKIIITKNIHFSFILIKWYILKTLKFVKLYFYMLVNSFDSFYRILYICCTYFVIWTHFLKKYHISTHKIYMTRKFSTKCTIIFAIMHCTIKLQFRKHHRFWFINFGLLWLALAIYNNTINII